MICTTPISFFLREFFGAFGVPLGVSHYWLTVAISQEVRCVVSF